MTTPPEEVVAEQKRDQRRTGVILILVALVLAVSLGFVYRTDRQVQLASQRSSTLEQQVVANGKLAQEAKEGVEEANRRLRAAGKPTVPVPSVSPISPPPSATVAESLTVDQVRAVVVTELAQYKATLTQAEINQIARVAASMVPKPADGKTPSKAEIEPIVTAALFAYCVGGKCEGKPGTPGPRGDKGEDGKDAPEVTDEDLLKAAQEALAVYCAADSKPCEGTPGPVGPAGPKGAQGRSLTGMDCEPDGRWKLYFLNPADGTQDVEYVNGPCRFVIPPNEKTGS